MLQRYYCHVCSLGLMYYAIQLHWEIASRTKNIHYEIVVTQCVVRVPDEGLVCLIHKQVENPQELFKEIHFSTLYLILPARYFARITLPLMWYVYSPQGDGQLSDMDDTIPIKTRIKKTIWIAPIS